MTQKICFDCFHKLFPDKPIRKITLGRQCVVCKAQTDRTEQMVPVEAEDIPLVKQIAQVPRRVLHRTERHADRRVAVRVAARGAGQVGRDAGQARTHSGSPCRVCQIGIGSRDGRSTLASSHRSAGEGEPSPGAGGSSGDPVAVLVIRSSSWTCPRARVSTADLGSLQGQQVGLLRSDADVERGGQHGGAVAAGAFTEHPVEHLPHGGLLVLREVTDDRPGYRVASQNPVPHFFTGTELDSLFVRRVHGDVRAARRRSVAGATPRSPQPGTPAVEGRLAILRSRGRRLVARR